MILARSAREVAERALLGRSEPELPAEVDGDLGGLPDLSGRGASTFSCKKLLTYLLA